MDAERWRLIEKLFKDAVDRPANQRSAFLDQVCGNDSSLRAQVDALLNSDEQRDRTGWPDQAATGEPTIPPAPRETGGFTPGTILAGRYRIVALLGRGGMGDVYRADDLTLGHPVALKFLSHALETDAGARSRFLAEVRITRQISHPNICRVYDISEFEGRYFLSMEYIDGENLASLLQRIGYLPDEKALDVTRQLLSGLAAAHSRGILHRDLKPANIMLDGRGRVRIMDFGLAIAGDEATRTAQTAGTPLYMAPEQFSGQIASIRTDIYALGLVFYEIFCGKKAFTATTLAGLRLQKENETPKPPSEVKPGINPVVDRMIVRCLQRDPRDRPESLRALAAAFPGGDPLAAAMEAGETPAPELVAAFGRKEGLRPAIAIMWALVFCAAIVGTILLNPRSMLIQRVPGTTDPAALLARSREFVRQAGYAADAADTASGFDYDAPLMEYIRKTEKSPTRWDSLAPYRGVTFWYRQSPQALETTTFMSTVGLGVTPSDPLPRYSGEVLVRLDTTGRLKNFEAIPDSAREKKGGMGSSIEWNKIFSAAGLDITHWTPAEPQWIPPYHADGMAAWEGELPEAPHTPMRIEAAASAGKLTRFELIGPWTRPARQVEVVVKTGLPIANPLLLGSLFVAILAACLLARRNLRAGRGDRRGARLLVVVLIAQGLIGWLMNEHHITTGGELILFFRAFSMMLLLAGSLWVLYIAAEPFARQKWPEILVAWTRLLAGDWRDTVVGREVLIGCAAGAGVGFLAHVAVVLPSWFGLTEELPLERSVGYAFAAGASASRMIDPLGWAIGDAFLILVIYLILTTVVRRGWLAAIVCALLMASGAVASVTPWIVAIPALAAAAITLIVLLRSGLVAVMVAYIVSGLLMMYPTTFRFTAWYSGIGFLSLFFIAAFAAFGFVVSIQGQKLLDIDGGI